MATSSTLPLLKRIFYIGILIQVVMLILISFKVVNIEQSQALSVVVERYSLLATLISVPFALKLFSVMMMKGKDMTDKAQQMALYSRAFLARYGILFAVAAINLVLFAISYNRNFLLCTLIIFTAYIFSAPSQAHITNKEL